MTETTVSNNAPESRFEIYVDGTLAGFSAYEAQDETYVFTHTETFKEFAGQGVASKLVGAALDDVRSNNQRVRPVCEYVAGYVDKHPEYQDLVV